MGKVYFDILLVYIYSVKLNQIKKISNLRATLCSSWTAFGFKGCKSHFTCVLWKLFLPNCSLVSVVSSCLRYESCYSCSVVSTSNPFLNILVLVNRSTAHSLLNVLANTPNSWHNAVVNTPNSSHNVLITVPNWYLNVAVTTFDSCLNISMWTCIRDRIQPLSSVQSWRDGC